MAQWIKILREGGNATFNYVNVYGEVTGSVSSETLKNAAIGTGSANQVVFWTHQRD